MGCITRLGCLFVLVVVAVCAWFTRGWWYPRLTHQPTAAVARTVKWEPVTNAGADSTTAALTRLSAPHGQVFQTLSPGAVASYIYRSAAGRMPSPADSLQASATGDQLSMRGIVPMSSLGGVIGPAVGIVHDREPVQLTGTLRVVEPGRAEFRVLDARVHGLPLPKGMIAALIDRVAPMGRPSGADPDVLPLPIPGYIGDIRVANGKVTLYKTVQ